MHIFSIKQAAITVVAVVLFCHVPARGQNPLEAPQTSANAATSQPGQARVAQNRRDRTLIDPNRIRDCIIKATISKLSPQEAGILKTLNAVEGKEVKAGEILAEIDESQPMLQRKAATAEYNATLEKSKSTIDERYAVKASDVAKAEWLKAIESNRLAPGSVTEVEVMRLKLTYERGLLEIERAQEERKLAGLTAEAKKVEVEAADEAIVRRKITAPSNGKLDKINVHRGEWLKPGDVVMELVNLEKLDVEGYSNKDLLDGQQLLGQPVEVEIVLSKGQKQRFPGQIVFVSDVVEAGGEYRVKAEIQNVRNPQTGAWMIQSGLTADILLNPAR
jgi:multidrug efflux pump subunit AcrA (membrane-fusion protein)